MHEQAFWKNLEWNLNQMIVQSEQAKNVNGRARSGYYKSAILLGCSVAEALAHRLLSKRMGALKTEDVPFDDWECFDSKPLPDNYPAEGIKLAICRRRRPRFVLSDQTIFKRVNEMCQKIGIFSVSEFEKIEWLRKEMRNKIHLQGLSDIERSWTKKDLDRVSSVIVFLVDKN